MRLYFAREREGAGHDTHARRGRGGHLGVKLWRSEPRGSCIHHRGQQADVEIAEIQARDTRHRPLITLSEFSQPPLTALLTKA